MRRHDGDPALRQVRPHVPGLGDRQALVTPNQDEVIWKYDPNCCPTGGFDQKSWHWNGSRFARARFGHSKSCRS